jgi:type I restriction enzyme S subunit
VTSRARKRVAVTAVNSEESEVILRRFRRYPAYKDSAVEWLAEIPVHWETRRLKFLAAEPIKNGIGEAGAYDSPEWPRYVRITDIAGPRGLRDDTFKSLPPELASEAPFKVDDLLFAAVGATFGKTYFHIRDIGPACFAGYLVRFSPGKRVDPSFAAYWTESSAYWGLVQSRVVQATIQNFSAARYRDLTIPLPPLDEQQAVGGFLDGETARIDELIAKKEQLLKLLKEKRIALITRVVTRGLDPNVPLKDSGVEWLGEIPAHWEVKRLWHLTPPDRRIMYGIVLPGPNVEEGVPIVKGGDISPERLRLDLLNRTTFEIESGYVRSRLCGGDLVYAIRGSIGEVAVVPEELQGANLTQDAARIAYNAATHGLWLLHALKSMPVFAQLESGALGATIRGINIRDLKRASIPMPPRREQERIARFLEDEVAKIKSLTAKVRDAIARLQELRTALISAAVIGKIDIREEKA